MKQTLPLNGGKLSTARLYSFTMTISMTLEWKRTIFIRSKSVFIPNSDGIQIWYNAARLSKLYVSKAFCVHRSTFLRNNRFSFLSKLQLSDGRITAWVTTSVPSSSCLSVSPPPPPAPNPLVLRMTSSLVAPYCKNKSRIDIFQQVVSQAK